MKCFSSWAHSEHIDILGNAKNVLVAGQNVADMIPIPGLSPAIDVLIKIIDKVEETKSNKEALVALSREISHLVNVINKTRDNVTSRMRETMGNEEQEKRAEAIASLQESSQLTEMTTKFCDDLGEMKSRADKIYTGAFFLRCFHSSQDAATLKELQDGIVKATQYFQLKCQVAILASVDMVLKNLVCIQTDVKDIKNDVQDVQKKQADALDEKVLESIPHADAGYRATVNTLKSNYLEGTRQELFDKLEMWATSPVAGPLKSVCILSGGAGTGKSTIASEYARRLHKRGTLGASFFFVRGVGDLSSTRLFFPTIAYQLAHSQPGIRTHIVRAAREHLKDGRNQLMQYEAKNLLQSPLQAVERHPPVFILVDALDECTENASELVPQMLQLLTACVRDVSFPVQVIFTSRPEYLVENTLTSPLCPVDVHTISLHDLSPESVKQDIAVFIRDRLSRNPASQVFMEKHPDIVERLAVRADGLFVYARTAMDFIHSFPDHVEERVNMLLSDDRSALGPLDDLYLTVLETAFPPRALQGQKQLRARVILMLGCIALLREHVSPKTLEALTHIPCDDSHSVLYHLRAVILFDQTDLGKPFRPMHATFPQFLIDRARCTNRLYLVDAKQQHARLAEACLKHLLALVDNPCRLQNKMLPKADIEDLEARVCENLPQHAQYACLHWAAHLTKAGKSGQLGALLSEFANTRMLVWLETLGYLDRLDIAAEALRGARDWFGQKDGKTCQLLDQGRQLVIDHFKEIDSCPDDVYGSNIPQEGHTAEDASVYDPSLDQVVMGVV